MSEDIRASVAVVAEAWHGSPYYDEAERWSHVFWGEHSLFRPQFEKLDRSDVVELACGHGRHAEHIKATVGKLYLIDVLPENIAFCRARLAGARNIEFIVGDGFSFRPVGDNAVSSIFCYDSMVHFSPDIVAHYLLDARRVLRPGGRILLHHSNYDAPPDRHYGQNPHARNHMTFDLFMQLAQGAGLLLEHSSALAWGGVPDLDRLSLLRRP